MYIINIQKNQDSLKNIYLGQTLIHSTSHIAPVQLPVIIEPVVEGDVPYTVLHPDMPTSLEDLQKAWVQLKEERDTFETQFYANEKKVLELTKQLHEEWSLNAYITPKRMRSNFFY